MKKIIATILANILVTTFSMKVIAHEGHEDKTASAENAGAVGKPVKSKKFDRIINITMNDQMKFQPENISIKKGETIKFVVKNVGKVDHEIVMGSPEELKEHAEMMKQMPGMKHADANQLVLAPNKSGSMMWKFLSAGIIEYACLQPGHNEAGMNGKITIE